MLEFSREQVISAVASEVGVLGAVLDRLEEQEVWAPTRCEPWDVAALAVHTVGAVVRVADALKERVPEGGGGVVSAVGYYSPDVRFSVEVDAARVGSALLVARRRSDAGEPARVLTEHWGRLEPCLWAEPGDRVVVTRHGDRMLLTDFLVTRVLELTVHGLDLADALGRDPWASSEALGVATRLLFCSADPVALEHVLPGLWEDRRTALSAVRAVTGRVREPDDAGLAEELREAGVRFLALGG
ncbi:maleylpyruvate isomerase N-terminal domain-containing protein [Nocardiopsis kunsanensis]|uniref:maleylpyruvate isomerase N-terminal domain-containing protein n=1 Tax=Nocardiopsis kunsanensis TaxID=141693 RepID=UPI00034C7005|nr:maleylpyruvate isomerase N-terminal domain-containing protein [Nocardiopsis kunsanensis]